MPGLVSLNTPTDAPPLEILVPENTHHRTQTHDTISRRTPSPSPPISRAKPSPDRKKKTPEKIKLDESALDNPDLGPFLLKLARDTITSGDNPNKALDYAIRASKSFEQCGGLSLELAMSLHVVAAIYCSLGRFEEAVPVLERAIGVPDVENGSDHSLAKFSGYMQLGDTHSMLDQLDQSISCYGSGLKIQIEALGESDPRVAETCRYAAVVHRLCNPHLVTGAR